MRMLKVGARTMMGAAVVVGALIGGWGSTQEARAAVASRGDPLFRIGPGATLSTADVKLQIAATVSSTVQHITYAIHAPQGTAVHSVLYTGGTLSGLESYTFVADQRTQQYLVVTTVSTQFAEPVMVTAQLVTGGGTLAAPISVGGQSNQPIPTLIRVGLLMSPNVSWGS